MFIHLGLSIGLMGMFRLRGSIFGVALNITIRRYSERIFMDNYICCRIVFHKSVSNRVLKNHVCATIYPLNSSNRIAWSDIGNHPLICGMRDISYCNFGYTFTKNSWRIGFTAGCISSN